MELENKDQTKLKFQAFGGQYERKDHTSYGVEEDIF